MKENKNIKKIQVKEIKYRKGVGNLSQIKIMARRIRMDGFKHPFYVVKDGDGYLLREKVLMLKAAKYLGYNRVPCIVETEEQRNLRRGLRDVTYIPVEDDYIPIFRGIEQDDELILDYFGRERLDYLQKYRKEEYQEMVRDNTLINHLKSVQDEAKKSRIANIKVMAAYAKVNDELKEKDPVEWLRKMSNISENVDELVCCTVIYK